MKNRDYNYTNPHGPHQLETELIDREEAQQYTQTQTVKSHPAPDVYTHYTRQELFALWHGCRWQENEVELMMDFSLLSKKRATKLINEFREITGLPPVDQDPRNKKNSAGSGHSGRSKCKKR